MKKKFPSIIKEVRGQGTMNGILIYPPIKYMDEIIDKQLLQANVAYGFWPANSKKNDIIPIKIYYNV